jgi:hypothetical protein
MRLFSGRGNRQSGQVLTARGPKGGANVVVEQDDERPNADANADQNAGGQG